MSATPPRPNPNAFQLTVPAQAPLLERRTRPNNNLMETRVLGAFNPIPGKSWIELEKGKRKYYRKSRRASRRTSRRTSRRASRKH